MQCEGGGRDPTPARPAAAAEEGTTGHTVGAAHSAAATAGLAEATWRRIDAALSPIIGRQGMAALFKRSVSLARAGQPSLAAVNLQEPGIDAYASLRQALAGQTGPAADGAQAALLRTFHELLSSLIGASLTERLLRSAAAFTTGGDAAPELKP